MDIIDLMAEMQPPKTALDRSNALRNVAAGGEPGILARREQRNPELEVV
jgi:hypothetical protein